MSSHLSYRPDIDGLRAVSVLGVILYHAGLGFPGGYTGVDVFFVISGYLITGLIAKNLDRGTFSLADYWRRRIARIWPASLACTFAVLFAGYFLLFPPAFVTLAHDAASQLVMGSNVRFWQSVTYFNPDAESRPLLHMWSLAVEEQFYVFFPPILMLIWRFGRKAVIGLIAAGAVVSFAIAVWGVEHSPRGAFFLLPTRGWEMMLGSLLALMTLPRPSSRAVSEGLSLLGVALIVAPMLLLDSQSPFPGVAALPSCLGATLLIYAGFNPVAGHTTTIARVLGSAVPRVIGRMSYSLYLWHWPSLAFLHYFYGAHLEPQHIALALGLTAVLSYLSWRYVEQPFRAAGNNASVLRVAGVAVGVSLAIGAIAWSVHRYDGMRWRFSPVLLAYGAPEQVNRAWETELDTLVIPIGATGERPDFLLWGDSHAMVISEHIDELAKKQGLVGVTRQRSSTVPVPGVHEPLNRSSLRADYTTNDEMLDWIAEHRPRHVVLCARWSAHLDDIAPRDADTTSPELAARAMRDGLRRIVDTCEPAGITVWLLTEVPFIGAFPEKAALQAYLTGETPTIEGVTTDEYAEHQRRVTKVLAAPELQGLRVIHLAEPFFADSNRSIASTPERPYYADDDHINPTGVRVILGDLLDGMMRDIATASD